MQVFRRLKFFPIQKSFDDNGWVNNFVKRIRFSIFSVSHTYLDVAVGVVAGEILKSTFTYIRKLPN